MPEPRADRNTPLTVAGVRVPPGRRRRFEIPVARLATGTAMSMPVTVVSGRHAGPRIWVSAAIHGDELNGVEIVRRVLRHLEPASLRGTVIAVPVVNVFGFVTESRYLPDRRDLNRSFPGSRRGSLAARLARLFMDSVVDHCTWGIDLHTGSNHRENLPQIRADLDDTATLEKARAFGAPLVVHSTLRDGSLREAAGARDIRVLLYEAGEALRFHEDAIRVGTSGVLRVMHALGMLGEAPAGPPDPPLEVRRSSWVRARRSGIALLSTDLGDEVEEGQELGSISDASDGRAATVRAPFAGVVIGINRMPLVSRGDALVHLGNLGEEAGQTS